MVPRTDNIRFVANHPASNEDLNRLFTSSWEDHENRDFQPILKRNLTSVCAFHEEKLVGFMNLAWDGGVHAFILDTTVHPNFRKRGIGRQLVLQALEVAKQHGIEWVHVDYEPQLHPFYTGCGFRTTAAGLVNLKSHSTLK